MHYLCDLFLGEFRFYQYPLTKKYQNFSFSSLSGGYQANDNRQEASQRSAFQIFILLPDREITA